MTPEIVTVASVEEGIFRGRQDTIHGSHVPVDYVTEEGELAFPYRPVSASHYYLDRGNLQERQMLIDMLGEGLAAQVEPIIEQSRQSQSDVGSVLAIAEASQIKRYACTAFYDLDDVVLVVRHLSTVALSLLRSRGGQAPG